MELSFIISDASFDKKNKVSKIVSVISNSNIKREKVIQSTNPKEAEKEGLKQSIQLAIDNKIKKPIFICDNKFAINEMRRESMQNSAYKSFFHYMQFLWLPREMTSSVDKFTQIFNDEDQKLYNEYRKDKSKRELYKENEIIEIQEEGLTYKGDLDNSKLLSESIVNNLNIYRNIIQKEYENTFNIYELDLIFSKEFIINHNTKLNGKIEDVMNNRLYVEELLKSNFSDLFKLSLKEISKIIWDL